MNDPSLKVWDNAVFDDDYGSALSATIRASPPRCPFRPISAVPFKSELFIHKPGKENRSPGLPGKTPSLAGKSIEPVTADEGGSIDAEIAEVEKEIRRLSSRLEALHLKKAERELPGAARRGRMVPSKFLEPKQRSAKKPEEVPASRKIGESPASAKFRRRSASLGPLDIINGIRLRQPAAPNATPVRHLQSRRKDCIFDLQGKVEKDGEEKKNKEDDGYSIVCPKTSGLKSSRNVEAGLGTSQIAVAVGFCDPGKKTQEFKEDVKTRKPEKRESSSAKSLQPKTLFQEAEKPFKRVGAAPKSIPTKAVSKEVRKSVPVKRRSKNSKVRTVSSRYSLITVRIGRDAAGGKRRKWSLPGHGNDGLPGFKKLRVSPSIEENQAPPECPGDQVNEGGAMVESSPASSIMRIAPSLPKICTDRRNNAESPRDSGRAKRVVELIGRESPFGIAMDDDDDEGSAFL